MYQVRARRNGIRYSYGYAPSLEEAARRAEIEESRMDKEERAGHIVGEKGEILRTRFRGQSGDLWDLIGSESTGKEVFQSIETVKNVKTGKLREISRRNLYKMTRWVDKK